MEGRDEGGGRGLGWKGEKTWRDEQKEKRDRKSRDLTVTESQFKKPERDTERLQEILDVTETERKDKNGQTEMWMERERTDQRGTMREGEGRDERKLSSSKIDEEA